MAKNNRSKKQQRPNTSAILAIAAGAIIIAVPQSLAWIVGIYLIVSGVLSLTPQLKR